MSISMILMRLGQLITAPVTNPHILWIALPLIMTMILIELYFSKHSDESLGWNSTLSNSLILVFVGIDLIRWMVNNYYSLFGVKLLISIGILLLGMLMLYLNFNHRIPEKIAFIISSTTPLNMIAYIAVVFVYTFIPIDIYAIIAGFIMILIVVLIFRIIHFVIARVDNKIGKEPKIPKPLEI